MAGCNRPKPNAQDHDIAVVTEIVIGDSSLLKRSGQMRFPSGKPTIKDCFLALKESLLPIPVAYRIQMLNNYEIRDVLQKSQQLPGDSQTRVYHYEIDDLDSTRDYMMFSVFNGEREQNYFLRYFRDTTGFDSHAVGLSLLETQKGKRRGSAKFVIQEDAKLFELDTLFPKISLRDFMDDAQIEKLKLSPEQTEQPEVLIWLPGKRNRSRIGVDLNVEAFGDRKTEVKNACRRTNLSVHWIGRYFVKEGLPAPVAKPKAAQKKSAPQKAKNLAKTKKKK